MTFEPNRPDPSIPRRSARGTLMTVGVALVLLVATVVIMSTFGASDNVDDSASQQAMPADPTEMRDQEAPADTGATTGAPAAESPATGGAAPAAPAPTVGTTVDPAPPVPGTTPPPATSP
jgi:hypothetical protein